MIDIKEIKQVVVSDSYVEFYGGDYSNLVRIDSSDMTPVEQFALAREYTNHRQRIFKEYAKDKSRMKYKPDTYV
ncbi:MAG: hypothetical protein AAF378_14475 [Cyanobacteria bacterium P01_A01_bin.84]